MINSSSSGYISRKWRKWNQYLKEISSFPCSLQLYSQIAEVWKLPRCLLTGGDIKKMWHIYIHTSGMFFNLKKKEILSFVTTWMMNLEDILLSGINKRVQEDPLEEEMATHPSILAWRIPWLEEGSGLQSTGLKQSQTWLYVHTHIQWCITHSWFCATTSSI